jgi:hypothetical protein
MKHVVEATDKRNSRSGKRLNFRTPYGVFEKLTGVDVRKVMDYACIT